MITIYYFVVVVVVSLNYYYYYLVFFLVLIDDDIVLDVLMTNANVLGGIPLLNRRSISITIDVVVNDK